VYVLHIYLVLFRHCHAQLTMWHMKACLNCQEHWSVNNQMNICMTSLAHLHLPLSWR